MLNFMNGDLKSSIIIADVSNMKENDPLVITTLFFPKLKL